MKTKILQSKIYLAFPRGFCAGVTRAVEAVDNLLKLDTNKSDNLYIYHEIVHNQYIIKNFKKKGVHFINSLREIPAGTKKIVISAHGASPEIFAQAKLKKMQIIDATCPIVDSIHKIIQRLSSKNYTILLIGHPKHDEIIGSQGWSRENIKIIDSLETAKTVEIEANTKLAWLSQTTLSVNDTKKIVDILNLRFPNIVNPKKSCICYATQNRQNAVQALADKVDKIIVIGSKNSSNTQRLYEIASSLAPSYQIDDEKQIKGNMLAKNIGITAGASVPNILIEKVINKISQKVHIIQISENTAIAETLKFPPVKF
ncbi:MAG: 4-hydroxy-3-methylbut-2-enyl diphosphate reductase [Bifidobacteriaceae bacterium]|jgi:4-hydroxy-3-methylbut-2-enyl diphosphate reductase|nr:4-hydroxy-3-methylbut-2-enyl diphosphate reductase [Bifidobacteriaceae bacterium]